MQIIPPDTVPLSILDRIKRVGAGLLLLAGSLYTFLWLIPEVIDPAWVAWGRKVRYLEAMPPMARGLFLGALGLFCTVWSLAIVRSAVRPYKALKPRYRLPLGGGRRRAD